MFKKIKNMLKKKDSIFRKKAGNKIKLFLSAEVAFFRDESETIIYIRNRVENSINGVLRTLLNFNDYGEGVLDIGIIQIVPYDEYDKKKWPEIKKYIKKEQDVEIRLWVDYTKLIGQDGDTRVEAFYENYLNSLKAMKEIVPETFDVDRLVKDFEKACVGLF